MKEYSIFLIGMYGIPSHITRFINNLKRINPSANITLYSDRNKDEFSQDVLNNLNEYIQQKRFTGWPHKLWRFRYYIDLIFFIHQLKKISNTNHYDIVNIHFPTAILSYVMKYLKKMSNTIIVSPWGSDVLRVNDSKTKRKLSCVFKNSDYITVGSAGVFGKVLCQEMRIEQKKFHPLSWGSDTIDYINEHISEISTERAKEMLNLSGKYLITCGYNAFEEQRHEIIINAIYNKRDKLPDNLTLLFPVTYGSSYGTRKQEYVNRLKNVCDELELPVVFYEKYISVADLFLLRQATDMFIHIQTTDGGNSSLQEYVLCGKKVVHGSWIHYDSLEKYEPLFYFPVNKLDELGEVIVNAYYSEPIKTPEQVMEIIRNRGWHAKIKLWNDFFISCLNANK